MENPQEVVLLDDGSDDEKMSKKALKEIDVLKVEEKLELDKDPLFLETVDRFLDSGSSRVIDLVEKDNAENRKVSKCLNSFCQSKEVLIVAPDFVRSHYGLPKSKNQYVCKDCHKTAIEHFKDLVSRVENRETIFTADFPKINPIVMIDSDDEEETLDEDEILPEEVTDMISNSLDDCINDFMKTYDVDFQVNTAVDFLEKKMTSLSENSKRLVKENQEMEKDLYNSLNHLYQTFLGEPPINHEVDLPYEELRPSMINGKYNDQNSASRDANGSNSDDVIMMAAFELPLALDLPPEGRIVRPKPKMGERFYVMKVSTFSEWVPGVVEDISVKLFEGKMCEHYKVKINGGKTNYQKEIVAGQMAYWEPPPVRLPVGTRVIALATGTHKHPKKFFSGITAEHPSNVNGCRYLIFFDDGYAQYALHENVRLVCETKLDVAEYFNSTSQGFIRHYLDLFPERLMLKVKKMDTIKTEFGGIWNTARVKNVDGALVQMLFLKDFRSEWIYRGSTRLYPVYEEASRVKREGGQIIRRGTTMRRHLIYSDFFLTQDVIEESTEDTDVPVVQPRAVARKSTNREVESRNTSWDRRVPRLDYGKVEADFPNALKPQTFRPHKCGPECISWTGYDPEKVKGVNPLIVPIMFGFRRLEKNSNRLVLSGDGEHTIAYDAPCGRKLRSYDEVFNYLKFTGSELTVDLFDFDYWVHIYDEYKVPGKFVILPDLSSGKEAIPIPCVNSVDNSVPPYMFYMTQRRGREGVFLNLDPDFLTCCDCTNDCEDRDKCACWQKTIKGVKTISKRNSIDAYTVGYQYRRLPDVVRTGIYECNQRCKCRKTCLNRVVQQPLKLKLQLFKTKRKGWGTRCMNDIPAGTFVCVYVGDILTESNANEGGKRFGDEYFAELDYIESMEALKEDYEEDVINGPSDEEFEAEKNISMPHEGESDDEFEPFMFQREEKGYGMQLRKRKKKEHELQQSSQKNDGGGGEVVSEEETSSSDDTSQQPRVPSHFDVPISTNQEGPKHSSVRNYYGKDESVYIMDAKTAGNIGRYLNHSCDPNLFVQNVFVDTHDLRFPWVAFFALRHIKAGTELTWDYRYEVGSVDGKKLYCYCESAECRGRLL